MARARLPIAATGADGRLPGDDDAWRSRGAAERVNCLRAQQTKGAKLPCQKYFIYSFIRHTGSTKHNRKIRITKIPSKQARRTDETDDTANLLLLLLQEPWDQRPLVTQSVACLVMSFHLLRSWAKLFSSRSPVLH